MKIYLALMIFAFLSCQNRQEKSTVPARIAPPVEVVEAEQITDKVSDTAELQELFIDSVRIGHKKYNKVEVRKFRQADSDYVDIQFYAKSSGKWKLTQKLHFLKDDILGCDTQISDFNNDGFNDMTVVSAIAARGANEVRRLFIYNKITDKLTEIKNSENFPNMRYNKDLNCIDAFLVYVGCSTVFLKISGDSLKEFASVELFDGITISEYDRKGKGKIIFRDSTNETYLTRFKTYKPLKAYEGGY